MPDRAFFGSPITSRGNARVKELRASLSGKASRPGELLGLEGEHLLSEAARSNLRFQTVYVREGSEERLSRLLPAAGEVTDCVVLSTDVFGSAVQTASPQGIAATVRIPDVRDVSLSGKSRLLLIEDLQDPGNFGTLLRTAEAFGFDQVFATGATVSEWNPKVVRSSAGSVFRLPVVRGSLDRLRGPLRAAGIKLFAAVVQANGATPIMRADFRSPFALMIGNEGAGLSHAALEIADTRVHIPCAVESLNAAIAGGTLMYEAFRQNLSRKDHASAHGSAR